MGDARRADAQQVDEVPTHDDGVELLAPLEAADALVPVDGQSALETLVDKSHKHAVGVSKELRTGIRES